MKVTHVEQIDTGKSVLIGWWEDKTFKSEAYTLKQKKVATERLHDLLAMVEKNV